MNHVVFALQNSGDVLEFMTELTINAFIYLFLFISLFSFWLVWLCLRAELNICFKVMFKRRSLLFLQGCNILRSDQRSRTITVRVTKVPLFVPERQTKERLHHSRRQNADGIIEMLKSADAGAASPNT